MEKSVDRLASAIAASIIVFSQPDRPAFPAPLTDRLVEELALPDGPSDHPPYGYELATHLRTELHALVGAIKTELAESIHENIRDELNLEKLAADAISSGAVQPTQPAQSAVSPCAPVFGWSPKSKPGIAATDPNKTTPRLVERTDAEVEALLADNPMYQRACAGAAGKQDTLESQIAARQNRPGADQTFHNIPTGVAETLYDDDEESGMILRGGAQKAVNPAKLRSFGADPQPDIDVWDTLKDELKTLDEELVIDPRAEK